MARYSVADAKNNLPKLIDRALAGEEVTITRRGEPVVRLHPHRPDGSAVTLDWVFANQVKPAAGPVDSAALIRELRDEEV